MCVCVYIYTHIYIYIYIYIYNIHTLRIDAGRCCAAGSSGRAVATHAGDTNCMHMHMLRMRTHI